MTYNYNHFLKSKRLLAPADGLTIARADLPTDMFDFQRDLTTWALRKGRAAIFADTGLGKTIMQLAWADRLVEAGYYVLIVAPLAVAKQTVREAERWGIVTQYAREQDALSINVPIVVTNYEQFHKFDPRMLGGVVLDESSILKSLDGKLRTRLIKTLVEVPFRLCCTATPAPNDIAEIANHAEFLGIMNRTEMLAHFFVHDDDGWRLKKHAREPFYRWLASWGMSIKRPSNLGYSDEGFDLPPLNIEPYFVNTNWKPAGYLFAAQLRGISERSEARKATLSARVMKAVEIVEAEPDEQWLIWCGLNDEATALRKVLNATEVKGNDDLDSKERSLLGFANGSVRRLVTKPKIAGHGMNWQSCARVLFCGLGDSWEQYYQAIRRCWRFGQKRAVNVHIVLSDAEYAIYENVMSKEAEAQKMSTNLIANVTEYERSEISGKLGEFMYDTKEAEGSGWKLMLGDSAERLRELPDNSVDLSVFSPPFGALYVYSNTERDLGNSKNDTEFFEHFRFVSSELLRVMKSGRNICVHVAQLPLTKATDGVIGMKDFRGRVIQHFIDTGFIYHGEVCIDKDPQAQAIRTHSKGLLFVQLKKDSSWLRMAFADYVLVFRKPGDNAVPIHPDIGNDEWIEWARPIWYGIKESDTLQGMREARGQDDERHICPLQLGTIERCIRLWSNKGETVLSPFAGIGSEMYQAIKLERQAIGVELKPEYFGVAVKNLMRAERESQSGSLIELMETGV